MPQLIEMSLICKEYGYTEEEYWNMSEDFLAAIRARRAVEAHLKKEEYDKIERRTKSKR